MKILAFTPTYNEGGNIRKLVTALLELPLDIEVLVIDDQSPDGTGETVAEMAKTDSRIHAVSRPPPRGRGLAGRDGFIWFMDHPEFDVLVEMDADFSHHPKFIPPMVDALKNADVVIGSRYVQGGAEHGRDAARQWTSKLANMYLRFVLRIRQRDCTTGYRAFTRNALEEIDFSRFIAVGPPIVSEVNYHLRLHRRKVVEVPILFEDRTWGVSKLNWKVLLQSLWFPLQLRLFRVFGII